MKKPSRKKGTVLDSLLFHFSEKVDCPLFLPGIRRGRPVCLPQGPSPVNLGGHIGPPPTSARYP